MRPQDQQLHRIRCSAKSLHQMRNSCAHKELQFHGVEDGPECPSARFVVTPSGVIFHALTGTLRTT